MHPPRSRPTVDVSTKRSTRTQAIEELIVEHVKDNLPPCTSEKLQSVNVRPMALRQHNMVQQQTPAVGKGTVLE